jgi:adenylate kinase family enzyme
LIRLGLLTLEDDLIVPSAALRLHLVNPDAWPDDLQGVARLCEGHTPPPVLAVAAAQQLERLRQHWRAEDPSPLTYLIGAPGSGRSLLARHLAESRQKSLISVDIERWPPTRDAFTLAREARWRRAAVLLRGEGHSVSEDWRGVISDLLEEGVDLLIALPAGGRPDSFLARAVHWVELPPSQQAERRALWALYLPQKRRAVGLTDEALAFRFRGSPATISTLARQALDLSELHGEAVALDHVQEAARCTMSRKLSQLAALEPPLAQGLAAVVLPPVQMAQLQELWHRVIHRQQVMETWGFGERLSYGLGTVALLSGPPGTGKTLSARALASELGVTLYRIDLSQVVSKWVGETEKHLGALFDEAEASGAALLFDEADALFAKRTEVRSSNDRYANLEVGYLLQKIELFSGLCFLTTNMDRSIDDAFIRRMAAHIRFTLPAVEEREAIWRCVMPPGAPLHVDVSFSALAARFEMGGGAIRNAAVRAAYRAAQGGRVIAHADLAASAELESAASGVLIRQSGTTITGARHG